MAAIIWTDSLSVRIQSIDKQHMKLIEMINTFYENLGKRSNNELISELIKGMKTYTIIHFNTEERYMKQYNYPNYIRHKKEHDDFIQKVNSLEEKFKKGTTVFSLEITTFLKDWIKKHIQETDKQYSDFFIKHGVK